MATRLKTPPKPKISPRDMVLIVMDLVLAEKRKFPEEPSYAILDAFESLGKTLLKDLASKEANKEGEEEEEDEEGLEECEDESDRGEENPLKAGGVSNKPPDEGELFYSSDPPTNWKRPR